MMHSSNQEIIGKEVDGYLIQSVLGRGGMGVVYRAEDLALSRDVALKMIDPSLAGDEAFLRRFRSEARALARVDSPHIVRVHALRQIDAGVFIVMECVDSGTLGDRIARGPLPWREAIGLFRQMLVAFEHAHGVGVIHRDIKPGNIMLTPDGVVKVTDFGLAKFYQQGADATRTQGISGTLSYMSPEQMKGDSMDARTDLWSLGVVLYEMLTGRKPFGGDTEVARMHAVLNLAPAPINTPNLPRPVTDMIEQLLRKDPGKRYQSAADVRVAVDALLQKSEGGQQLAGARSYRSLAIGSAAILFVLLAGSTYLLLGRTDEVRDRPAAAALSLSTSPSGAYIFVRDRSVGQAPIENLPVEAGPFPLYVRLDGYRALDTTIVAASGDNISLWFDLIPEEIDTQLVAGEGPPAGNRPSQQDGSSGQREPAQQGGSSGQRGPAPQASFAVRAVPGGDVEVDGRRTGDQGSVDAGRRRISCTRQSARVDTVLTLVAGDHVDLTCYFEATVNVQVLDSDGSPSWGTVLIDGRSTDQYGGSFRVGAGVHRFMVRREGFTTIDEEKELTIRPSFRENTYRLVFHIRPGAE